METLGLTIAETAQELKLHEQTVRALVREGRIRTVRVGRRHIVPRREVEVFLELEARPA